jgi:hypothetical protein
MMIKRSLLVFALCSCAVSASAEVYKWIDADGKIQYGDAPPKNVKATVVSGGVTVVPAIVIPQAQSGPNAVPEGKAIDEGARGNAGRKPDDNAAQVNALADQAAAAREEARARAIARCKANRGVDCENEVDAELNGEPGAGYVQGWSLPPVRPHHPIASTPRPHSSSSSAMLMVRPHTAASAPAGQRSSQSGPGIKPMQ